MQRSIPTHWYAHVAHIFIHTCSFIFFFLKKKGVTWIDFANITYGIYLFNKNHKKIRFSKNERIKVFFSFKKQVKNWWLLLGMNLPTKYLPILEFFQPLNKNLDASRSTNLIWDFKPCLYIIILFYLLVPNNEQIINLKILA